MQKYNDQAEKDKARYAKEMERCVHDSVHGPCLQSIDGHDSPQLLQSAECAKLLTTPCDCCSYKGSGSAPEKKKPAAKKAPAKPKGKKKEEEPEEVRSPVP